MICILKKKKIKSLFLFVVVRYKGLHATRIVRVFKQKNILEFLKI